MSTIMLLKGIKSGFAPGRGKGSHGLPIGNGCPPSSPPPIREVLHFCWEDLVVQSDKVCSPGQPVISTVTCFYSKGGNIL